MSSLGGTTNSGNSVAPGVPGAGNVDRWATYTAIQDIDGGGFTLKNTNIDLCNDAIENMSILDSTLTGTTTLASGHTYSGESIISNPGATSTANINESTGSGIPALLLTRGSSTYGADVTNDYRIRNEFGTLHFETAESTGNTSGKPFSLRYPDITTPGEENGIVNAFGKLVCAKDADIAGNTNCTGLITGNRISVEGATGLPAEPSYIAVNASDPSGGPQILMTRGLNTYGFDQYNDWRMYIDEFGNFYIATDQIDPARSGNILRFVPPSGGSNGIVEALGDLEGQITSASQYLTAPQVRTNDITGRIGGNITITCSNPTDFIVANNPIAGSFAQSTSAGQSKVYTRVSNVKWQGTSGAVNVNGFEYMAPNGVSCFTFCGQRDAAVGASIGLACKNADSSTIVGFAPSAISGIEKWSFTAKHQAQYSGVITKEHKGMVVVSTGKVVGIYDKGEIHKGINHEDPNYSNATPVVKLSSTRASKSVVGVVKDITDAPDTINGDLMYQYDQSGGEVGDKRVQVNAIGEGLIWVANTNGNILNGDLLQTSNIEGYAEKQDDDIMRSCTIGKLTMDCDFIQEKVSKQKVLKDDEGENVLDSQGRLIWVNSDEKEDKYKMRYLPGGKKAVLLSCIYYCG